MKIPSPSRPGRWLTCVEPEALVHHFLRHPPENFTSFTLTSGLPGFLANFDLLTTADEQLQTTLKKIPGMRRLLTWRTCFIGSTASEFCPLPAEEPDDLIADMFAAWDKQTAILIVKDIPGNAPFLGKAAQNHAERLIPALEKRGFFLVEGQALAYLPIDFADEDDYLARLSPGRRRDIRRKLRSRRDLRIEVIASGDSRLLDPDLLSELYGQYLEVYAQSEIHFDLLTLDFFKALLHDTSLAARLFLYYREGELIGHNLCFIHNGMLIDKYVGFRYPAARECNLYFVSWMENLGFAKREGLRYYIAGWTDPAIKSYLGARFTRTRHAVYVKNPLLRTILRPLAGHFEQDKAWGEEPPA